MRARLNDGAVLKKDGGFLWNIAATKNPYCITWGYGKAVNNLLSQVPNALVSFSKLIFSLNIYKNYFEKRPLYN
ncbi:hypothetical protein SAMN05216308_101471 [Nitrosospira sp. Nsp13]|nr:hypothetical protein SAMN05216308_101471 [Nitrosospira sp. Nsp13]